MKIGTRVIRAGIKPAEQGEPFRTGITFAGPFHASGDPKKVPYTYGRYDNPTFTQFENALAELEGGPTIVFSSGMAAIAAVFGTCLRLGDVIVMPGDCYFGARLVAEGYFSEMGAQVRQIPTATRELGDAISGSKLLWLESPANPGLDVCGIAELAKQAYAIGALVAVDNTTATVLGQQPLALGADFSVASDTKSLTGHSDLILGHVAVRDQVLAEKLLAWRTQMGSVPGPMEVWLAHRSLATLEMRLERQCSNSLKIAEYLKDRNDVSGVRYPGLADDPSHEIASDQMQFFGPVVGFVLPDAARADKFLHACKIVFEASSFGGIYTTAERRARWGGDNIPEGFIRLSVGCEDAEDLIEDISRALNEALK
ncbi:MAG: cystathionine gamma-lyase [Pyrinomonadaceae bacterium]